MKYYYSLLFALVFFIPALAQDEIKISGKITDGNNALPDVRIELIDSEEVIYTNREGRYSINARPKQSILFTYTGMTTIEYITEDVNAVVNLEMYPEVQKLNEVVVQKRRKSQEDLEKEYATNKRVIKTGFGYIDQDRVGYSVRVIDGDQLSPAGLDFIGSLQSFVPGMRIFRPNGISRVDFSFGTDATRPLVFLPRRFMSFQNPRPVAYEVDGQLMTDAPIELQVFNIKRIAVISSVSALAKYGTLAAGGLIVINTRGGAFDASVRNGERFDQAKRWDNIFDARTVGKVNKVPMNQALERLQSMETKEEANAIVDDERLLERLTVYNQIEVAKLFLNRWQDEVRYLQIMDGLVVKHSNNAVILKTIAFLYEDYGNMTEAIELYKQILKLRPDYAQSYRDLANAYAETGDNQKSIDYLGRYIRHISLDTLSVPAQGIDSLIFTEYDNALARSGVKRFDKRISDPAERGSVRLIFEWTHGDSDFELQFVNPENRYFTWQHSSRDTPERIRDEKLKGYSSEQFFVDETMPGRWQVNMKYLGNKSFDPTYLKISVYYNYGTAFERKESFVHKLSARNVNYKLLSFINSPIVSAVSR